MSEKPMVETMKTYYEPYDGDYNDADYGKLLNDIETQQGLEIGAYIEICMSMEKNSDKILVCCSNDEGNEWEYTYTFDIPAGWELAKVREMFEGNVYLKTDAYKPEVTEDDCGEN